MKKFPPKSEKMSKKVNKNKQEMIQIRQWGHS